MFLASNGEYNYKYPNDHQFYIVLCKLNDYKNHMLSYFQELREENDNDDQILPISLVHDHLKFLSPIKMGTKD